MVDLSGWHTGGVKGCREGVKVIIQKHSSKKFKPATLCLNFNKVILVSRSLDVPCVEKKSNLKIPAMNII